MQREVVRPLPIRPWVPPPLRRSRQRDPGSIPSERCSPLTGSNGTNAERWLDLADYLKFVQRSSWLRMSAVGQ